jgi:hypothetical protein
MSRVFIAALLLIVLAPPALAQQPANIQVWDVTFQWGGAAAITRENNFNLDDTGSDNDGTPFTYTVSGSSVSWTYTVSDRCIYTGTLNGNAMSGTMFDPVSTFVGAWSAVPQQTIYGLTVSGGTGSGFFSPGTVVTITAGAPPLGQAFYNWSGQAVASTDSSTTTLVMPASDATVTALYGNGFTLTVANGAGGGTYTPLAVVPISANAPPSGQVFYYWTGFTVANIYSPNTTLVMPGDNAMVTAFYSQPFTLTVANGSGGGNYGPHAVVPIAANTAPAGQAFYNWSGATVADQYSASTTLTMPSAATSVTAQYIPLPTVASVTPSAGLLAGGTLVTISGTGFAPNGALSVSFGGVAATGIAVQNSTTLVCTAPAGTATGLTGVVVSNPGGGSANMGSAYYYYQNTPPLVATPAFSPVGADTWYDGNSLTVTMSCATNGAAIYYTTNGALPTTSSTLYSGPFSITDSVLINALAVKAGWADSLEPSTVYDLTGGQYLWSWSFANTDGFNVPDEIEWALGIDPVTATTNIYGENTPVPFVTMTLKTLAFNLSFKTENALDSVALSGSLSIPAGFDVAGQQIVLDVGGAVKIFKLDGKGNGHIVSGQDLFSAGHTGDRFKLQIKSVKGTVAAQTAPFTAQFKCINGALFVDGFNSNYAAVKYPYQPPVIILFNKQLFFNQKPQHYSVKASGK